MRFVVDLYRGVILLCLTIGFIGASYIVAVRVAQSSTAARIDGWSWTAAIGVVVAMVVFTGFAATVVAMHDRLAEMRREMTRIANALEGQAAKSNDSVR